MPRSTGPYLGVAAICERVLQEHDGVLSLIRVIDRIGVQIQTSGPSGVPVPVVQPPPYQIVVAVTFKSGEFRGQLPLKLMVKTPSGFKWPEFEVSVLFEGDDRGVNVVLPMQFPVQDEGLYWFVVELGGEIMTRIPLRVIKQTSTTSVPPQL